MQGQWRVSACSQGINSHASLRRCWHRYPQVHFPSLCLHLRNTLLSHSITSMSQELSNDFVCRFCYHQKLSIAGNCRMCLVEVGLLVCPVSSVGSPCLVCKIAACIGQSILARALCVPCMHACCIHASVSPRPFGWHSLSHNLLSLQGLAFNQDLA